MALINIDGKLTEFSNDTTMLTLTDEEYKIYPNAKNYSVCITETRMIINHEGIESSHEKIEGSLVWVDANNGGISLLTRSKLTWINLDRQIESIDRYLPVKDRKNEWKYGPEILNNIRYDPEKQNYHRFAGKILEHIEVNDFITHLYELGSFIGSAYRSHNDDLILTPKKIIRCAKYHNHLLAKCENKEKTYLILLCYGSCYMVECDILFPSITTKSAKQSPSG